MLPYLTGTWANPSSVYREAQQARGVLETARERVAAVLNAGPDEIIFTSGGTEADNLAIRGLAEANDRRGGHVIVSAIEHHAVLHAAEQLQRRGFDVTLVPVDGEGFVDARTLTGALRNDTVLISIGLANNEVGAIQPPAALIEAVHRAGSRARFHTDAVQAAPWMGIEVAELGVDALSLSAHKFGGPKGVGALYLRRGVSLAAQNVGGGQERNRRGGTESVALAVGLATALEFASAERYENVEHARHAAEVLRAALVGIPGCRLTGPADPDERIPGLVSCVFEGVAAEDLLIRLDLLGFAASSGAACTTGSLEPSHVLVALGIDERTARGSLRLSVGPETSLEDVQRLASLLPDEVVRLRALSEAIA
jgi:cysteine desulfurase